MLLDSFVVHRLYRDDIVHGMSIIQRFYSLLIITLDHFPFFSKNVIMRKCEIDTTHQKVDFLVVGFLAS